MSPNTPATPAKPTITAPVCFGAAAAFELDDPAAAPLAVAVLLPLAPAPVAVPVFFAVDPAVAVVPTTAAPVVQTAGGTVNEYPLVSDANAAECSLDQLIHALS